MKRRKRWPYSRNLHCFENHKFDGHELVASIADAATGLRAIIAIHNTVLGPAIGALTRRVDQRHVACTAGPP
jgi:glutamate dehydrogenase/leucine dehydrogenase